MQDHLDKSPSSRPRILLRSGAVGVVLLFSGCATTPDTREIVSSYETLKVEIPAPIQVEIRPIDVVCSGATCTMSAEDFLIHEADITALARVKQALEVENQSRARAYNEAVTSAMHRDLAAQYSAQEAEETRKALERYRLSESLRMWLERAIYILGVYVLSL